MWYQQVKRRLVFVRGTDTAMVGTMLTLYKIQLLKYPLQNFKLILIIWTPFKVIQPLQYMEIQKQNKQKHTKKLIVDSRELKMQDTYQ